METERGKQPTGVRCAPPSLRAAGRAPPIDLAAAITKKDASQAAEHVAYVKKRHPEVTEIFGDFNEAKPNGSRLWA